MSYDNVTTRPILMNCIWQALDNYISKYIKITDDIRIIGSRDDQITKPTINKKTVYELMNVFLDIKEIYTKYVLFNK